MSAQDSFDDVGNERGFRRGEFLDAGAVRAFLVNAVDAGIGEVNRHAIVVHGITTSGSVVGVGFVVNEILARIGAGLCAGQALAFGLAAAVFQIISRIGVEARGESEVLVAGDRNVNRAGLI